jgi:hypothetical protein
MNGLEQTFYIIGIIFMSLTFLMILVLVIAVLVIRKKINKIHDTIETKIDSITSLAEHSGQLSALAGTAVIRQAKKAFKKDKK